MDVWGNNKKGVTRGPRRNLCPSGGKSGHEWKEENWFKNYNRAKIYFSLCSVYIAFMWTERSDYRTVSEVKGQRSAAGQHTQNISACERHSCSSTPPPPAPTLSSLSRGVKGGRTAAHRPVFMVTCHQTAFYAAVRRPNLHACRVSVYSS